MKSKYLIASVFFIVSFFICASVSAETGAYTKGDTVTISGTATGNPQQGLAFWVFGPNYWTRETKSVSGDTYTYEIQKSVTESLSAGRYFCVVQHPMYNGIFDADLSSGAPASGQISVSSTAGQSFIIDGTGKLQGSSAAYALMNMLDSPDIDDTYSVTEFTIAEPWIRFEPKETYYAGDRLLIEGQTNIAAGERLLYELTSASFYPASKGSSGEFYGQSGYTTVVSSYPENTWSIIVDTSEMQPDLYIFKISREDESAAYTSEFTLLEERPVATEPAEKTPVQTENNLQETAQATPEAEPEAPAAGTGVFIVLMPVLFVFAVKVKKRFF